MSETTQTPDPFAHIPAEDAAAIKAVPFSRQRVYVTVATRCGRRMCMAGDQLLSGARQSARVYSGSDPAIYKLDKGVWKSVSLRGS